MHCWLHYDEGLVNPQLIRKICLFTSTVSGKRLVNTLFYWREEALLVRAPDWMMLGHVTYLLLACRRQTRPQRQVPESVWQISE